MMVRLFVVGTDTAVGKTALCEALLSRARARDRRWIPFKPAQSGRDEPSDAQRLRRAAGLPEASLPAICPLQYDEPLAPGIAEDPARFTGPAGPPDPRTIAAAAAHLDGWPAARDAEVLLIEGAGGLHVPMPGGTWQAEWILALATHTLVVGRLGLGTINHTLATIEGLRAVGRPPLGFVLSAVAPDDPSSRHNAATIAVRSGVDHLGTLPGAPPDHAAAADAILDALLARL
jgi:dethiobiotin synthetase